MVSLPQRALNLLARLVQKPILRLLPPRAARAAFDANAAILYRAAAGLRTHACTLRDGDASVPALWVDLGGDRSGGVLIFLHGGGFVMGSLDGYRSMVAALADEAGMAGLLVDYRLAPEHPFPAAPEDALTAYRAVLRDTPPDRIALAGDSAGGGLALGLLHQIGALGLPMPAAVAVVSPATDLTGGSASLTENRRRDPIVPLSWARRGAKSYLGDADPYDPRASPLYGRFAGAPPVMIQYAVGEILEGDAQRMAAALRQQGIEVRLDEWRGVPHVWHLNAGRSPEADRAIADLAEFLRGRTRRA